MTELLEQPKTQPAEPETIEKVAIVDLQGLARGRSTPA